MYNNDVIENALIYFREIVFLHKYVFYNLITLLEKLCSLEYSLVELWLDPPDREDRAENSSRFFLATVVPTPPVLTFDS